MFTDIQYHFEQSNRDSTTGQASLPGLGARTAAFEPVHIHHGEAPSLGDLWRHLKGVQSFMVINELTKAGKQHSLHALITPRL